jgi:dTDP-4-dehydrorhamnose reductase
MLATALGAECARRGWPCNMPGRASLDVTDAAMVSTTFAAERPELVFHTAALTRVNHCEEHPDEAYAVNAQGTAHVTAAAAALNAQLVYFSTDYVFPGSPEPLLEDSPTAPLNVYGASKLAGEAHVRGYALGHIVRLSGVFGPRAGGGERNFIRAILEQLDSGRETVEVVADQFTALSYAPHVAEMLGLLLEAGLPPVLHLSSGGSNSWYGWACEVARAAGADPQRVRPVPTPEGSPVRRPAVSVLGTKSEPAAALIRQNMATDGISTYFRALRGAS